MGAIYQHDVESLGVDFIVPARADVGATARSLILVTPDAQRTMNTFLGAAQMLDKSDIDPAEVAAAGIVYLEGYLWDPPAPRAAMEKAIDAAHAAGRKVAFTLSDTFCVDRHRDGFWQLLKDGRIDILFANEAEAAAMTEANDVEEAIDRLAEFVPILVVTRSEAGATAVAGRERADVPAAADRAAGRHHRRRRFVRRRLPRRPGAWAWPQGIADPRRHRRRRGHPALRRPAGKGFEGAGRRLARLTKKGRPKPPPLSFELPKA